MFQSIRSTLFARAEFAASSGRCIVLSAEHRGRSAGALVADERILTTLSPLQIRNKRIHVPFAISQDGATAVAKSW